MTELKPCPFCGGEAKVNTLKWVDGYEATALCKNEPNLHYLRTWDEDEAKAVERITEAWNTRAERTCKQERLFNLIRRECDGEWYEWHGEEEPTYCPHCGARVIGG